ncbi:Internalin-A [Porphyridium purpureum]|uniref:Internalin-A n=1 Tax=Porphyridium purpureum TaxID=35688 RepID=A0A5J4Z211_PORPP|nr:Internalin-A [Porphyridium purpureum]|eukprot:POR8538..scf208_2
MTMSGHTQAQTHTHTHTQTQLQAPHDAARMKAPAVVRGLHESRNDSLGSLVALAEQHVARVTAGLPAAPLSPHMAMEVDKQRNADLSQPQLEQTQRKTSIPRTSDSISNLARVARSAAAKSSSASQTGSALARSGKTGARPAQDDSDSHDDADSDDSMGGADFGSSLPSGVIDGGFSLASLAVGNGSIDDLADNPRLKKSPSAESLTHGLSRGSPITNDEQPFPNKKRMFKTDSVQMLSQMALETHHHAASPAGDLSISRASKLGSPDGQAVDLYIDDASSQVGQLEAKKDSVTDAMGSAGAILKCEDASGNTHVQTVEPSQTTLVISGLGLVSVDLVPLFEMPVCELKEVSLVANALETINLTPLSRCRNLTALMLNGNRLTELDLEPLRHCTKLERLWIHNNKLSNIDLEPLSSCESLRSMYLDCNQIDTSLDLSPLQNCKLLRSLRLTGNKLAGRLDITPLLQCVGLSAFDVGVGIKLYAYYLREQMPLPSAFRRKASSIEWVKPKSPPGESVHHNSKRMDVDSPALSQSLSASAVAAAEASSAGIAPVDGQNQRNVLSPSSSRSITPVSLSPDDSSSSLGFLNVHQQVDASGNVRYRALLINFRLSDYYSITKLLESEGGFECTGVTDILYDKTDVSQYALAVIQLREGNELASVKELKRLCATMPIVLVGAGRMAEVASTCLRHGADRFMEEPFGKHSVVAARDLVHRRLRKGAQDAAAAEATAAAIRAGASPASSGGGKHHQPGGSRHARTPSTAEAAAAAAHAARNPHAGSDEHGCSGRAVDDLRASGKIPPLSTLRRTVVAPSGGIGGVVRNRMEKPALEKIFARSGGAVKRAQFTPIATLCGLPVCVAPLLFEAAREYGTTADSSSNGVGDNVKHGDDRVPTHVFMKFWLEKLQSQNGEGRLVEILMHSSRAENDVNGKNTIGLAMHGFRVIAEGLVRNLRSRIGEGKHVVDAVVSFLVFGLRGLAHRGIPITKMDLKKANFCARLLGAESGMYEGSAAQLRPDRFCSVRSTFENASGCTIEARGEAASDDSNRCVLRLDAMIEFCRERSLLTPRGVKALYACHVPRTQDGMRLPDFARFWAATSDYKVDACVEYFFLLLDVDMDGYVSAADSFHFYSEKKKLMADEGLVLADFWDVWVGILDLVYPADNELGISLHEMLRLSEKNRVYVIQALMFRESESTIDIRRTLSSTL